MPSEHGSELGTDEVARPSSSSGSQSRCSPSRRVSPVPRRRWLTSGRAKNVVVAVVPNGRTLGKPAKRYPLPQPVVGAMATLAKR